MFVICSSLFSAVTHWYVATPQPTRNLATTQHYTLPPAPRRVLHYDLPLTLQYFPSFWTQHCRLRVFDSLISGEIVRALGYRYRKHPRMSRQQLPRTYHVQKNGLTLTDSDAEQPFEKISADKLLIRVRLLPAWERVVECSAGNVPPPGYKIRINMRNLGCKSRKMSI